MKIDYFHFLVTPKSRWNLVGELSWWTKYSH